ncbi:hypothetical protein V7S43_001847 [Phytophthora oleae]|uniref:Uncharacterized protein n=1 Tax=Phytophthora oleae TaxID=2107226 RepID=A0ABD3G3G6_9STRA
MNELFRGRLNGKDQVPPARKRNLGFYFEGQYRDPLDDEFPRRKTEFPATQRRLLDEFDDAGDIEHRDTVEGDEILQVLLRANLPRAVRRRFTDSVAEAQFPSFVRELDDVPPSYGKSEETTSELSSTPHTHETERQDEDSDESSEQASPLLRWPPKAHWVGTLLIGISIVLTWPIGLAYFRG